MKRNIESIQVLRGLAALAVVCHHAFRAVTVNRPADVDLAPMLLSNPILVEIGAMGVDVFFVLSGFLMVYISRPYITGEKSIGDFLMQRAIRIWPLYAVVTLVSCVLIYQQGAGPGVTPHDLTPLRLASFFFVPSFNHGGLLQPILGVGWTLNYEAMFYLCFAAAILLARHRLVLVLAVLLFGLYTAGLMLPQGSAAHAFLSNAVIFEFLFGAVIGHALVLGRLPIPRASLWFGFAAMLLVAFAPYPAESGYRLATRGLCAAALFVGVLHLEGKLNWPRALVILGNASYSIYLVHILLVYRVTKPALHRLPQFMGTTLVPEVSAAIAIAVCLAAGIAVSIGSRHRCWPLVGASTCGREPARSFHRSARPRPDWRRQRPTSFRADVRRLDDLRVADRFVGNRLNV
jgi:peptidoglycan/LPS O-acetylase OafA/YrhL